MATKRLRAISKVKFPCYVYVYKSIDANICIKNDGDLKIRVDAYKIIIIIILIIRVTLTHHYSFSFWHGTL